MKRKTIKCVAGLLSAAILFTSEGMSCLAFAAPKGDGLDFTPPLTAADTKQ